MSVRSFFGEISRPMQGENIIYQKEGLVTSIKAMKIKGSVGEDSEVLASDGSGGIEWRALDSGGGGVVPSLAEVMGVGGTAGADLDMGEFDINKSSALIISAPSISLSGPVSFTDIPTCPDAASATQPEQLVSKGYVDSAISQEMIASGGVDSPADAPSSIASLARAGACKRTATRTTDPDATASRPHALTFPSTDSAPYCRGRGPQDRTRSARGCDW